MRIYDLVKKILEESPACRDSDKKLQWAVWWKKGLIQVDTSGKMALSRVMYMDFENAPSSESITRARRKCQELHPELQATSSIVRTRRQQKQETKGTFIFSEKA